MLGNTPITLGVELESVISNRDLFLDILTRNSVLSKYVLSVTTDASVESVTCRVGSNSKLFLGSSLLNKRLVQRDQSVSGYELVTKPLQLETMRSVINHAVNLQVKMGEIFSPRSSIHVHAGFPAGLIFYKSAVAMGLFVEPLLFKIAGMGEDYRGAINNSAYCRPLALPPVIPIDGGDTYFAKVSPEMALDSANVNDFWNCFAISPEERNRYVPIRYMGVNVYSILLRGTLEFRFFNFCTVTRHIQAVVALCQTIADLTMRVPLHVLRSLDRLSIFEKNSDESYVEILNTILRLASEYNSEFQMVHADIENIAELIRITPQPVFVDAPIATHVKNARISGSTAKFFKLPIVTNAKPAGIIDVHNFRMSDRKLLEI